LGEPLKHNAMRFKVYMKLSLPIVVVLVCSFAVAQDDLREHLLQSKGNTKVSKIFNETPVLPIDDVEAELYRMTFIPTFFSPIKIRVERHRGEYVLVAKRLSGQGGFEVGPLKDEKRRRLKSEEWNRLLALIDKAGFWEMPYAEKEPQADEKGESTVCLHGSEWVLEGVKEGKFHAVNRYCPNEKRFEKLGEYFAKLSGLGIKQRELY
jgi:hypothetical protein